MGKIASLVNVLPRRDFHDLSQSIYGTMTWGLLYPVYNRFFNAGDIVKIKPNFVIRTAPTVAPMFSPVEVRLHRFWCPLRLYHNAMRENSRQFDYTNANRHTYTISVQGSESGAETRFPTGTLYDWLYMTPGIVRVVDKDRGQFYFRQALEPLAAYWDIVRNYYGFSKNNIFSYVKRAEDSESSQQAETLDVLDVWVEGLYNSKKPLNVGGFTKEGYGEYPLWPGVNGISLSNKNLDGFAVAPANPDGLSRFIPSLATDVVHLNGLALTIPSLAVAAKAQSVKDILSAAGTRFTDYLYAFFKTSIPHSDIPSLLYSGKFYLNSSPVFQNSGGTSEGIGGGALGSFVGSNIGSAGLSSRRYKFDEPGYLMDILSIRPVYAWSGIMPYYNVDVDGSYMFNPRFNQLGYRSIDQREFGFIHGDFTSSSSQELPSLTDFKTPFWNEFRSSADVTHGAMRWNPGRSVTQKAEAYFVLQRSGDVTVGSGSQFGDLNALLFCDLDNINNYFAATSLDTDNTYLSSYYDVTVSSFVSKRFATDLTA